MVGRWGMSEAVGPIAVLPADGEGPFLPGASETSEHTQRLVDEETQRIVADAHAEVSRLLTEHRDQLESLTRALLEAETLDAPDAYAAAGVPCRRASLAERAPTLRPSGAAAPRLGQQVDAQRRDGKADRARR